MGPNSIRERWVLGVNWGLINRYVFRAMNMQRHRGQLNSVLHDFTLILCVKPLAICTLKYGYPIWHMNASTRLIVISDTASLTPDRAMAAI